MRHVYRGHGPVDFGPTFKAAFGHVATINVRRLRRKAAADKLQDSSRAFILIAFLHSAKAPQRTPRLTIAGGSHVDSPNTWARQANQEIHLTHLGVCRRLNMRVCVAWLSARSKPAAAPGASHFQASTAEGRAAAADQGRQLLTRILSDTHITVTAPFTRGQMNTCRARWTGRKLLSTFPKAPPQMEACF